MKKTLFCAMVVGFCCLSAWGTLPDSRYQYAADGEYDDLLVLPWASYKVGDPTIEFQCPKCIERQKVADRYVEAMLFNGIVKFAAGNVVAGLTLVSLDCKDEMKAEVK